MQIKIPTSIYLCVLGCCLCGDICVNIIVVITNAWINVNENNWLLNKTENQGSTLYCMKSKSLHKVLREKCNMARKCSFLQLIYEFGYKIKLVPKCVNRSWDMDRLVHSTLLVGQVRPTRTKVFQFKKHPNLPYLVKYCLWTSANQLLIWVHTLYNTIHCIFIWQSGHH